MPNPWTNAEKARAWTPHGKAGNVQREEQVDVLLSLVEAHRPQRVLDLGCGMGDIDAEVLRRSPDVHLTCLDESSVMLERTAESTAAYGRRVALLQSALEDGWAEGMREPFDAVMSSQAIHHMAAGAKRALFGRVREVLRPGGLFVLSDKVAFEAGVWRQMIALWDRVRVPAGYEHFTRCETHAEYVEQEIAGGDVPDTVASQLLWLQEAGFDPVECFWRNADKAIFGGIRSD